MFKIKRTEIDAENRFKISTPDGYIEIAGTSEFVVRFVKDFLQNSEEMQNEMRKQLRGETIESVAAKMRDAGFPEDIVRDFENGEFWDDLIDA